MPRNDQVTRQWYLLRKLEGPRSATLQELAESLPDDFPKHLRPLRRDLAALEAEVTPFVTGGLIEERRIEEGPMSCVDLGFLPMGSKVPLGHE